MIQELQSSDSENQLQARRAERELREERERSLRMERELEGWKAFRLERGSSAMRLSDFGGGSRRGSGVFEVPQRKFSNSKGFL